MVSFIWISVAMLLWTGNGITCSAGTYDSGGSCYTCPRGHYCSAGQDPIKCKEGQYASYGASSCTNCPAGFKCPNPLDIPIPCVFGEYTEGSALSCYSCPAGYYCPTPNVKIACTRTSGNYYFCLGGTNMMHKCPAGYQCPYAEQDPEACGEGQYALAGSAACTDCPAGKFCPHPSLPPQDCPPGYYSIARSTSCIQCPADSYCSDSSSLPVACAETHYAPPMSTTCTQCPAGYACDRESSPGVPIRCANGYYSAAGSQYCKKCLPGNQCPNKVLEACSSGYYSIGLNNMCLKCPAGSVCASTSQPPIACPRGTHSGYGATSCTVCAAGHMCPSAEMNFEIACPKGQYQSLVGQIECVSCTGGSGCSSTGSSSMTYCSDGYYYDGLLSCKQCPAGFHCPFARLSTVLPCGPGFWASAGSQICTICLPGYSCPDSTSQVACSTGYFSIFKAIRCYKCPGGYECNANLKTGWGVMKCPPGYTIQNDVCTVCPVGHFCPEPAFDPVSCPSGTFARSTGMSKCQPCPHGSSCVVNGASTACASGTFSALYDMNCNDCPAQHYCINGIKEACPLNYYSNSKASECTPCPAGSECLKNAPSSCSSGYYSKTTTFQCTLCPPGYECPDGTTITACSTGKYAPYEGHTACLSCPTGFYSPEASSLCYPCPGGHSCSYGTWTRCPIGKYSEPGHGICKPGISGFVYLPYADESQPPMYLAPKGTYSTRISSGQAELFKCPNGTFNPMLGATSITDCITCPAGYYCLEGTSNPFLYECPQNYYCVAGSAVPTACPTDTYTTIRGATTVNVCAPCASGYNCNTTLTTTTEEEESEMKSCPIGYYCPYSGKYPCPAGTYSGFQTGLRTADECEICPAGFYCPEGSASPLPAPLGHYNPYHGAFSNETMLKCPPSYPCNETGLPSFKGPPCKLGYYCPAGTINPDDYPCPEGTYSSSYFAISEDDCLPCPPGYACGLGTSQPNKVDCKKGYYCPRGTKNETQYSCPNGTYMPNTNAKKLEDCLPCPHGSYCFAGTETPVVCPEGHYCPLNTTSSTQYPCRAGTYSPAGTTGLQSQEGCLQCEFGKYCKKTGMTLPEDCPIGTYNNFSKEATACLTCPGGYYCGSGTINPTICAVGTYSDNGQSACTACEIGYYCPETGISKASKLANYICMAGAYCKDGTVGLSVHPNLDDHGCSAGHYCPAGTTIEKECPAGTYNPVRGRSSEAECLTTVAGFYTLAGAITYLSTPCSPGYFCLNGSSSPTQYSCPPGTYRKLNQGADPTECATCPSGYYCPEACAIPVDCPMGYYCPIGTVTPESCPEGTYSATTNLFGSKACTPCPAGKYCPAKNMTNPTEPCDAGFYCIEGSRRPEPKDNIMGNPCPAGGYCPSGASTPQACPAGTYMLIDGAWQASQCISCPPGYYCLGSKDPSPTGQCDPGYYCSAGESERAPAAKIAGLGYYAPSGSQFQLKCPRGKYSNQEGRSECDECDPGYQCTEVGMSTKPSCPAGYYCPSLTTLTAASLSYGPIHCPKGMYNDLGGRASENDCKSCPGGYYCDIPGLSGSVGPCEEGFYCKSASYFARPYYADSESRHGPCPEKYYCPQQTTDPVACPVGTYSKSIMLTQQSDCLPCYEGKYCASAGIGEPTGDCSSGYYCPKGQTSSTPYSCVAPQYCPSGVGSPIECPTGFYQDENNKGYCKECPSGSYCFKGTVFPCPAGFYCP